MNDMDQSITVTAAGETYTLLIPSVPAVPTYGPRVISNVSELNPPAQFNYVTWRWGLTTPLQDVFKVLGANDVLVLPERPEPYLIDTSKGFRSGDGIHDVAMTRCKAGIIGMGPGAVIDLKARQVMPKVIATRSSSVGPLELSLPTSPCMVVTWVAVHSMLSRVQQQIFVWRTFTSRERTEASLLLLLENLVDW